MHFELALRSSSSEPKRDWHLVLTGRQRHTVTYSATPKSARTDQVPYGFNDVLTYEQYTDIQRRISACTCSTEVDFTPQCGDPALCKLLCCCTCTLGAAMWAFTEYEYTASREAAHETCRAGAHRALMNELYRLNTEFGSTTANECVGFYIINPSRVVRHVVDAAVREIKPEMETHSYIVMVRFPRGHPPIELYNQMGTGAGGVATASMTTPLLG